MFAPEIDPRASGRICRSWSIAPQKAIRSIIVHFKTALRTRGVADLIAKAADHRHHALPTAILPPSARRTQIRHSRPMNPRFPIYIPSKGRHEACMTMRHLDAMGVPYRVIVEAAEYSKRIRCCD